MVKSKSSKRVKASKNGIDRISNLPDPLLSHILSLLPTKCAVATSVLSSRWKFIWSSITNLDICSTEHRSPPYYWRHSIWRQKFYEKEETLETKNKLRMESKKFTLFVNRVLLLVNSPSIQNFRIKCYQDCFDPSYLNLWFSAGLERTVHVFDLSLTLKNPVELPLSHIYCSVSVLKLYGDMQFNIPAAASVCFPSLQALYLEEITSVIASNSFVSFPNLKIVELKNVDFKDGDSLQKLFSSCPVLDDLIIEKDVPDEVKCLTIRIPSLTRLSIYFRTLNFDWTDKIEIDSPALQYLDLNDRLPCQYVPGNLCSLLHAKVEMEFGKWDVDNVAPPISITKFIESLSEVKFLSISCDVLKAFRLTSTNISTCFHNLTRLEIKLYKCLDFSVLITNVLESMDNLVHLVMEGSREKYCSHQSWWREPRNVPKCLLARITTVSCAYMIDDCCDQLEMLRYFLKNAEVLQSLTICIAHLPVREQFELLKNVSLIPRGSRTCQVAFT